MHTYNNYEINPDPPHQPMYLNQIIRILEANKVTTVLDAGCGDGNFSASLSSYGFKIYGFDLEQSGVMKAKSRGKGDFVVGDIYDDYRKFFEHEINFDAVISVEVIEHLYDPKKFLYNSNKILPQNGLLVITTPYWGYLKSIFLAIFNKMDRLFTVHWDGGHIKHFSHKSLRTMVESYGFQEIYFKGAGRKIPFLWSGMLVVFRKEAELKNFDRKYQH